MSHIVCITKYVTACKDDWFYNILQQYITKKKKYKKKKIEKKDE